MEVFFIPDASKEGLFDLHRSWLSGHMPQQRNEKLPEQPDTLDVNPLMGRMGLLNSGAEGDHVQFLDLFRNHCAFQSGMDNVHLGFSLVKIREQAGAGPEDR